MKKICTKCNNEKETSEFHKSKDGKFGVRAICKECLRACDRLFYEKNKEIIKPVKNKKQKIYYSNNKEKIKKYSISYYHKNKILKGRPKKVEKTKIIKLKAPTKTRSEIWKNYYINNKERLKTIRQLPEEKIKRNIYKFVSRALNKTNKSARTIELLGLSIDEYREYLECLFTDKMTWGNYGKYWHIDHVVPLSTFNLNNLEEQKKAFNFRNTRPLEAKENIRKGNRCTASIFDLINKNYVLNLSLER